MIVPSHITPPPLIYLHLPSYIFTPSNNLTYPNLPPLLQTPSHTPTLITHQSHTTIPSNTPPPKPHTPPHKQPSHHPQICHIKPRTAGTKLKRGYSEPACTDDRPCEVTHLIFVVHGIGQMMAVNDIIKSCSEFVSTTISVHLQLMVHLCCINGAFVYYLGCNCVTLLQFLYIICVVSLQHLNDMYLLFVFHI